MQVTQRKNTHLHILPSTDIVTIQSWLKISKLSFNCHEINVKTMLKKFVVLKIVAFKENLNVFNY